MYYGIGKNDGGENMYILLCVQFSMYKADASTVVEG